MTRSGEREIVISFSDLLLVFSVVRLRGRSDVASGGIIV